MLGAVARKLFGSANDRRIRSYQPRVDATDALDDLARAGVGQARRTRRCRVASAGPPARVLGGPSLASSLVPPYTPNLLRLGAFA